MPLPWLSLPLQLLGISSLLVIATGVGLRILPETPSEGLFPVALRGCGLGLGVFCGFAFLFGILGLLKVSILGLLLIPLAIWGTQPMAGWVRQALDLRWFGIHQWTAFEKTLLAILAIMVVSHLLFGFAPPTADDELSYHLSLPAVYAREGRFMEISDIMATYYPQNAELLYSIVLLFGSVLSVKTLVWFTSLLVLAAIGYLAHYRLGMKRDITLLALTLFAVMPYTSSLSGVTSVEFLDVFFELLAVDLALMARPLDRRNIVIAGIFSGLGMGTRPYAYAWVMAITALIIFQDRKWREAILFLFAAGVVCSPWPLRSFFLTGNPFYPAAFWPGAAQNPFFVPQHLSSRMGFWQYLRELPVNLTYGSQAYGMGLPALVLAPCAMADQSHDKEWWRIFLFLCIVAAATFTVPLNNPRYLGQMYPFFTLAGAAGYSTIRDSFSRWATKALTLWLIIALVLPNAAMGAYWGAKRLPFFLGYQSWNAYLEKNYRIFEGYPMMQFITAHVAPGSQILGLGSQSSLRFYYPQQTLHCMVYVPLPLYNLPPAKLAATLAQYKISHVLLIKSEFKNIHGTLYYRELSTNISIPPLTPPYFEKLFDSDMSTLYAVHV